MNRTYTIVFLILSSFGIVKAQIYDDYLGAGHNEGITVSSSSNSNGATAENTINGEGLDAPKMEAARFLAQATFGGSMDEIRVLARELDFEAWIDQQFEAPTTLMLPKLWEVNQRSMDLHYAENPGVDYFGPYSVHFQYTWWDNNFKAQDQLRQRIAFALSQIAVISLTSELGNYGEGLASYYDVMIRHSFGNYEDFLQEVTLNPNMGYYLTHLSNPKTDLELDTKPDENFAREIMQLFSIGLYELNNDGTRKTDSNGDWIPTYDNSDITELAKVFTGLKGGAWSRQALMYVDPNEPVEFFADIYSIDREVPMQMDESQHEPGPKTIIGDYVIPGGQTGLQDIRQAVTHLFNHDNVGPFLARRLIQQLIKSNPTPGYINRVANAFNNNGSGVRGDMKAVIKAILLDNEARDCAPQDDPNHGKLREPVLRFTQIMHGLPTYSADGYYWNNGFDYNESTKQLPLMAPTVFNFYLPDHQPVGPIVEQDLFAPEFQIHNSQTAIGYMNQVHKWTNWRTLFWDWHGEQTPNVIVQLEDLYSLSTDIESLINHLDIVLTHGQLSDKTRKIIRNSLAEIPDHWDDTERYRTELAVYLFMISPDYVVIK